MHGGVIVIAVMYPMKDLIHADSSGRCGDGKGRKDAVQTTHGEKCPGGDFSNLLHTQHQMETCNE
jgi:hypothetical protein